MLAFANAEVVGGGGVDVQFGGNAGSLEGQVHDDASLGRADDVVAAVHEENRWSAGRDAEARCELVGVFGLEIARIDGNGEVRPATDFVNAVDGFVRSLVEVCGRRDSEMAPGREADDADLVW